MKRGALFLIFGVFVFSLYSNSLFIILPIVTSYGEWSVYGTHQDDFLGWNVSSAGDVNGDGFADILISSPYYDNGAIDEGAVFVFYGSENGPSVSYDWIMEGDADNAEFGCSACGVGDVNCDGYDDILIGAPGSGAVAGKGFVFIYTGSNTGLSSTEFWSVSGTQLGCRFGESVSGGGDINGDGFMDIIIGAPLFDSLDTDEGIAYVYAGGVDSLYFYGKYYNGIAGSKLGTKVAFVGDINLDGLSDMAIGAPYYGNEAGAIYVVLGNTVSHSAFDVIKIASQDSARFGYGLSGSGDLNGDCKSEIVVGSPYYDETQINEGCADIFEFDGDSLISVKHITLGIANACIGISVSSCGDVNGDGLSDIIVGGNLYSGDNTSEGIAIVYPGDSSSYVGDYNWYQTGRQDYAEFGYSVSGVGDVNGDGYNDIIVGARYYDDTVANSGAAFVYYGGRSGISKNYEWAFDEDVGSYSQAGYSVAMNGDINGDGYDDIVVGVPYYDNGTGDEGRVYVYYGSNGEIGPAAFTFSPDIAYSNIGEEVAYIGDVNNDGYDDLAFASPHLDTLGYVDNGGIYVFLGSASGPVLYDFYCGINNSELFGYDISYGDINGDGYDDMIVGAPGHGSYYNGAVFIYTGSASGLSSSYDWSYGYYQNAAFFGGSVCSGDVNGDSIDDIVVGAKRADSIYTDNGTISVFYGSAAMPDSSISWMYFGEGDGEELGYATCCGDVNNDGKDDVIAGAPYACNAGGTQTGAARVYYGKDTPSSHSSDVSIYSPEDSSLFGRSVCAGDVNGDDIDDIIVGSPDYDDDGAVLVYKGGTTGVDTTCFVGLKGEEKMHEDYGRCVCCGDCNNDGKDDILIGDPYFDDEEDITNSIVEKGYACMFWGTQHPETKINLMQIRSDKTSPVSALSWSMYSSRLYIAATVYDSRLVKLNWEIEDYATPFDGIGTDVSAVWYDVSAAPTTIYEEVTVPSDSMLYKWRVRIAYEDRSVTRWYYIDDNGPTEPDFRTGNYLHYETDLRLSASVNIRGITLYWNKDGDTYKIYRNDSLLSIIHNSSYCDREPLNGMNVYRIECYKNGKKIKEGEIAIPFNMKDIEVLQLPTLVKLNDIKNVSFPEEVKIYGIDGRKIDKIENSGTYYIIYENNGYKETKKIEVIK